MPSSAENGKYTNGFMQILYEMYLWNTMETVLKSSFYIGHMITDVGVSWNGIARWACIQNLKFLYIYIYIYIYICHCSKVIVKIIKVYNR